jgi:hypothetical protein
MWYRLQFSAQQCYFKSLGTNEQTKSLSAPLLPVVIHMGHFKSSTHYVFSLKMNLFYKIHLRAFNVISVVLYHSGRTFGQVLYSCLDSFLVDASDYSGHLIRHLLNTSEAFPTEWFLRNKSKSGGLSPPDFYQTLACSQNWRNHSEGNA